MNSPISTVLFDLGNTLIYDKEAWPPILAAADRALWNVLVDAGVGLGPKDVYPEHATFFGFYNANHRTDLDEPSSAAVLGSLLSRRGYPVGEDTLRQGLRAMYRVTQANWYPVDQALPVLRMLRDHSFRLGIVSNAADDENTQTLIDKGAFRPYLEYVISSASLGKRKPHAAIFRAALDYFQVPPEEAVMIGDTYEADVVGGHQAGMQTVWIRHQASEVLPAAGSVADAVVEKLVDVPALLSGSRSGRDSATSS
jgi:HAD superfamily hydrolase (TIGR01509 family)